MKQKLLKSFLLLCTLLVGSSVWGVDKVTDVANIEDGGHYFIGCTVSKTDYYLYVDPTTSAKGVKKTATADATEFIFTSGTGGGWYIQIASNGKYISLPDSKDNAKVNVQDDPDEWTATNVNSLIQLKINGFLLQGNSSSSLNFGSYASGQTNVWLLPKVNDTRAEPNLGFTETEVEASVGQEFTPPTLTAAGGFDGVVEYESSNPLVAQVMDTETGDLRIVSGGTTTITATFEGDENFKPGSASYTLTVSDNRIATTISMDDIIIELADIASLTKLVPVVKDANGSEIEYTYGEWPTEVSFEYESDPNGIIGSLDNNSGEITLNAVEGTVTLKAYYNLYGINDTYKPSECTFTITVYNPLNGIGEFCGLTSGASGTLKLTDAVVLYVNGKDMFVCDATGAVDFYNTSLDYKAGDVLNGMITAKYTVYNKMPELTTPISNNTIVATAGSAPEPTEITTSDAADNVCNLVKLTNVKVTKDGTKFYVDDVQVYDKFKLGYTIEAGKTYDIVGIIIPYNSIYEICPIEAPTEIVVETATVGAAGYATYVTKDDVSFPDGVEAYIVTGIENNTVKLAEVAAVPKGTPVILKNEGEYELDAATGALDDVSGNELRASDEPIEANGTQYVLANVNGKVGFYKATGTIAAGKAYLEVAANIKAFYFDGDAETAINEVNGQSSMINGQSIYNLAGQRINKLQKGINIVNGKKILK